MKCRARAGCCTRCNRPTVAVRLGRRRRYSLHAERRELRCYQSRSPGPPTMSSGVRSASSSENGNHAKRAPAERDVSSIAIGARAHSRRRRRRARPNRRRPEKNYPHSAAPSGGDETAGAAERLRGCAPGGHWGAWPAGREGGRWTNGTALTTRRPGQWPSQEQTRPEAPGQSWSKCESLRRTSECMSCSSSRTSSRVVSASRRRGSRPSVPHRASSSFRACSSACA